MMTVEAKSPFLTVSHIQLKLPHTWWLSGGWKLPGEWKLSGPRS